MTSHDGPARRRVLGAGLAAAALAACSPPAPPAPSAPSTTGVTVAQWVARRRAPYVIAHRGAGAVLPEHTLPAYRAALGWGVACLEVSVVITSDGVPVCLHDQTLDRTTDGHGPASAMTAAQLERLRVRIPRLGPAVGGENAPPIPRLDQALDLLGGKAVLCLEAKDDRAYEPMMRLVHERGLDEGVMVKAHETSRRIDDAHAAGLPVFGYLGSAAGLTAARLRALAARLTHEHDVVVIPAYDGPRLVADHLVDAAVGTGRPVWAFPVSRRAEMAHLAARGVEGFITPDPAHLGSTLARRGSDAWREGRLAPGDLTRDPYGAAYGPAWPGGGALRLETAGAPAFVTAGSLGPLSGVTHTVQVHARIEASTTATAPYAALVYGHADDRYYEPGLASGPGYEIGLAPSGRLSLTFHDTDARATDLASATAALPEGGWVTLRLTVDGPRLTVTSDAGHRLEATHDGPRGGYVHLGRSGTHGAAEFAGLTVG